MKDKNTISQAEDSRELIELLRDMTPEEKAQVKGIIVGMKLAKDTKPA